jgi:AraC-like DNA-binding protein
MTTIHRIDFEKNLATLEDILLQRLPESGDYPTSVDGFTLHRYNHGDDPKPRFYDPVIIIVVQGKKRVRIGMEDIPFGERSCFIAGVNMPVSSCVLEASEDKPYLSMSLNLDKSLITTLSAKLQPLDGCNVYPTTGAVVQDISPELLDAFLRLLELTEQPEHTQILGSLVYQEIHYRLLTSRFGYNLRQLNTVGSQNNQINQAIIWIKDNYKESLHVDELARSLNMATSTFHKYFKEITTLSPLQYQKHLRISEAQHLMLSNNYGVTQAAFAVGYKSVTQFNREYKRLFGESPFKDVMNIKTTINNGTQDQSHKHGLMPTVFPFRKVFRGLVTRKIPPERHISPEKERK